MRCRALPILLSIVIIFAHVFPATFIHPEHPSSDFSDVIATNHDVIPVDKAEQDHKSSATCSPGVGCTAFTVPVEEVLMFTPLSEAIAHVDIAKLVTRTKVPPLPPPKIIIFI